MEKYAKLFKGLEMCAGPDCNPECPYHGETRGGKTCRAWLLNDAAAALMGEESLATALQAEVRTCKRDAHDARCERDAFDVECAALRAKNEFLCEKLKETEKYVQPAVLEAVAGVTKLIADANYWHGYADALKWHIHDRFVEDVTMEDVSIDLPDMRGEPEPEAGGHD